ncbi:hypothetical protein O3M35_003827 [Rhynocoris fuscipes]|uniref:Transmembrane protein 192 n=1 Tax=Rhynocoris fuscipes TaxID=488301 RepID=A0AAW1CHJ6_9HEMI
MNTSADQLVSQCHNEIESVESDNFKPLGTRKVALFHLVLACSLEILVIVLFLSRENSQNACGQIIVILFSQTSLWIISYIFDAHYRHTHNLILRLRGHLSECRSLDRYSSRLLQVITIGNAVIICALGILFQLNTGEICHYNNYFSPTYIIFYLFSAEIVILFPNLITYILNVHFFNVVRPLSDVENYEWWSTSGSNSRSEIELSMDCDTITGCLEKQADLIYYYKSANKDLSKKLYEIQNRLQSGVYSNDGCPAHRTSEIHMP